MFIQVLFMSDGGATYPSVEIKTIKDSFAKKINVFWTVGFGGSSFTELEKMA